MRVATRRDSPCIRRSLRPKARATSIMGAGRAAWSASPPSLLPQQPNAERSRHVENHPLPMVRRRSRGSGEVVRIAAARFAHRPRAAERHGQSGRKGRERARRQIHAGGAVLSGAERRYPLRIHACDLVHDRLRRPGRGRPAVECAAGRRHGRAVRLAQGPLRNLMADRAARLAAIARRLRSRQGATRHAGNAADGEARHRKAEGGACRRASAIMEGSDVTQHRIVSSEEWLAARKALLAKEKEFTRLRDRLSAERRGLPWVKIEKPYVFEGPAGKETLGDLFGDKSQL